MDLLMIEEIEDAMRREFKWGEDDCCLWACNVVKRVCGIDLARPLRGYSNSFGAARKLKDYAGAGLCEAAIKLAARSHLKPASRPYRGNLIGVVVTPEGPALALLWRGRWVARTRDAVTFLPLTSVAMAWRLPCQS